MASTRKEVIAIASKYIGAKQGDSKHRQIVDTFNKIKPRGEIGNYSCAWCAMFATAVQSMAGNGAGVVPQSYNCGTLISEALRLGIWQENDNYTPKQADMIIYYWDAPAGNCNYGASHVGIVSAVDNGDITVIEGNMKGGVCGTRKIPRGWRYIRGYITPKYNNGGCCIQAAYNATAAQLWRIEDTNDGYVKIVNKHGGVLDVVNGSNEPMKNGRKVQAYTDNGTDAQRWKLEKSPVSDGYFLLSKLDENYCLDVTGGALAKRAYLQIHEKQSKPDNQWAQTFSFRDVYGGGEYKAVICSKSLYALDSNPTGIKL